MIQPARPRHRGPRLVAGLLFLLTAACGGDGPDADAPDPLADLPERAASEVYRLGGIDAPDEAAFQVEPAIVVDSRNFVYAIHPYRARIAVFGPDGTFVRWIGGSGEGPGEFQVVAGHGFVGDTLWVRNVPTPRLSRFLLDGTHVATERLPYDFGRAMSSPQGVSGYLGEGRAFVRADGFASSEDGPVDLPVLVGDASMEHADTLFTVPNPRGRLAGQAFAPFAQPPWFDVASDGSGIILAQWSDDAPSEVRVRRFAPDGTVTRDWAISFPPVPVPAAVRDSVVDAGVRAVGEMAERLREQGIPEGSFRASIERSEVEETVYLPSYHPPVRRVLAGIDGTIWIQTTEGLEPGPWIAFGEDGTPLFRVRLPGDATLRQASREGLWSTESDGSDVPYVVHWRFEATGG